MITTTTTFVVPPVIGQGRGIIVVKVGDSIRGSIPTNREQAQIKRKVVRALREAGRSESVVVLPYWVTLELHEPAAVPKQAGMQSPSHLPGYPWPAPLAPYTPPIDLSPTIICRARS